MGTTPGQVRSGAIADATRPITPINNGYRRIIATVNDGVSEYNGLETKLSRRFSRNFSAQLSYTYAHAVNTVEPDVPSQDPNDANPLGLIGARDQPARPAASRGVERLVEVWTELERGHLDIARVRTILQHYNGADNNGDNSTEDRPVINGSVIGRNAGRGTPAYDVSTFLERRFPFADHVELTARGSIQCLES